MKGTGETEPHLAKGGQKGAKVRGCRLTNHRFFQQVTQEGCLGQFNQKTKWVIDFPWRKDLRLQRLTKTMRRIRRISDRE